jgi:Rod binding domain-containing protein
MDARVDSTHGLEAASAARLAQSSPSRAPERDTPERDTAQAAQKFQELFAQVLVKEMSRALPEGFFGQGAGADVFEGWLAEHLGAQLARNDGLGMGSLLEHGLGQKSAAREADPQEPTDPRTR